MAVGVHTTWANNLVLEAAELRTAGVQLSAPRLQACKFLCALAACSDAPNEHHWGAEKERLCSKHTGCCRCPPLM